MSESTTPQPPTLEARVRELEVAVYELIFSVISAHNRGGMGSVFLSDFPTQEALVNRLQAEARMQEADQ